MELAGKSWRGYFSVGEELTSGIVDEKEGFYLGDHRPGDDARPLHGANLYPNPNDPAIGKELADLFRNSIEAYMKHMSRLGRLLLESIERSLDLPAKSLSSSFRRPTTLFRIFHYPPHDRVHGSKACAVGEHTDYGYLTILKQDMSGGLQIKSDDGTWHDVSPIRNVFVVNLGDALERATGGLLRATPHRVRQRTNATSGRFSWPFFFDPSFDAPMRSLEPYLPKRMQDTARRRRTNAPERWDRNDPLTFEGTYGDYLISKVSKVFPTLTARVALSKM